MCSLEKRGNIYMLTLTGDDQHRFNPTLLDAISAALHRVRSETIATSSSSALVTTAHGKFFSNGYDLDWAMKDPNRPKIMSLKLRSVIKDLISLPMPTIMSGVILALSHDYVFMRKDRGFMYMSEMDIGLKVPVWFAKVLRCKIGSPAAWKVLGEEVVKRRWKGHVYVDNRLTVFGDVLSVIEFDETVENVDVSRVSNNVAKL